MNKRWFLKTAASPFSPRPMTYRRIIQIMCRVCAVMLLLSSVAAQGQLTYTNGDGGVYEYVTNGDGISVMIVGYAGPPWVTTMPTKINGFTVTSIGNSAFQSDTSLTSIDIPASVTNIGDNAFYDCTQLANVVLTNGITYIGQVAFGNCSRLANINIPSTVTNIDSWAFQECTNLTSMAIPNNVVYLGEGVFYACSGLTNITLSNGLLSTGAEVFSYCTRLKYITIPRSLTYIQNFMFDECTNLTGVLFTGNAPGAGVSSVFGYDPRATVYYLPATTGWGNGFANRPAVKWNPLIVSPAGNVGVPRGNFGFTVTNGSTTNYSVVVMACSNLANPTWIPLQTNLLTNSFYFSDSRWTNYSSRFYGLGFP